MRASASMPLASRAVRIDGRRLLDGGMTSSIPLKAFEAMGYSRNIVILTQPRDFKKTGSRLLPLMRLFLAPYPRLYQAMKKRHQVYNEEKAYVFSREEAGAALVICPEKALGISRTERNPDELQRCYDEGRRVCGKLLPKIRDFMGENI